MKSKKNKIVTVQDLITQLQQFDPNMEIRVKGKSPDDWDYQNEIKNIKVSKSNWEEDENEEGMIKKKIVVIDGGIF